MVAELELRSPPHVYAVGQFESHTQLTDLFLLGDSDLRVSILVPHALGAVPHVRTKKGNVVIIGAPTAERTSRARSSIYTNMHHIYHGALHLTVYCITPWCMAEGHAPWCSLHHGAGCTMVHHNQEALIQPCIVVMVRTILRFHALCEVRDCAYMLHTPCMRVSCHVHAHLTHACMHEHGLRMHVHV